MVALSDCLGYATFKESSTALLTEFGNFLV